MECSAERRMLPPHPLLAECRGKDAAFLPLVCRKHGYFLNSKEKKLSSLKEAETISTSPLLSNSRVPRNVLNTERSSGHVFIQIPLLSSYK